MIEHYLVGPSSISMFQFASPPIWFRYGVLALVTLMLCACQNSLYQQQRLQDQSSVESEVLLSSTPPLQGGETPAIYQRDPHLPPSDIRQVQLPLVFSRQTSLVRTVHRLVLMPPVPH